MTVRKIMIIRHAEKPPDHGPGPTGVKLDGSRDDHDLVPRGWQRAGALASLFAPAAGTKMPVGPLERPEVIIAAGADDTSRSRRSQSTVSPTAEALNLSTDVITAFYPGDEGKVAKHVGEASEEVVLICWEHKHIADLVTKLTDGSVQAPHWSGTRFDIVFVLVTGAQGWSFEQVPQMLLSGDQQTSVDQESLTANADQD